MIAAPAADPRKRPRAPCHHIGVSDSRIADSSRELGRFLFNAEHFDPDHAALAILLGLNGLGVTEACDTNIEDLGFERGPRTLQIAVGCGSIRCVAGRSAPGLTRLSRNASEGA